MLIVLGARFDDRAIGKTEQFCPNAKIIHVDIDRAELGKIKQPHVAIQADVDDVLAQLIPQVEAQPRAEWHQLVADLQREFPCPIPKACDPLSHYGLINAVAACVDDNAIITTDVGQHQMWTAQAYPLNRPRQWPPPVGWARWVLACLRRLARRWRTRIAKCCVSPATAA